MIDIPNDGNVEKTIAEENVARSEPVFVSHASEHLEVGAKSVGVEEGYRHLRFRHVKSPMLSISEVGGSNGVMFSLSWSLTDDFDLSLFEFAVDFAKNTFLPDTQSKMANYSLSDLVVVSFDIFLVFRLAKCCRFALFFY